MCLLLVMSTRMSDGGVIVGTGEKKLAKDLGVARPRIAERMAEARRARLVQTLGAPGPGRPVDYQAVLAAPVRQWVDELPIGTASSEERREAADRVVGAEVGTACKVLLMVFVHLMNGRGEVYGLRREDLAELLGISPSRVAARIGEATRAGLLVLVDGGTRGRKARYRLVGRKGTAEQYRFTSTRTGEQHAESGTHEAGHIGPPVLPADTHNARAVVNRTRAVVAGPADAGVIPSLSNSGERAEGMSSVVAPCRCPFEYQLGQVEQLHEPGRIHARAVAASLDGVAAEVWICEAADPYKDIAAQLGAGVAISDVVITQSPGQVVVPDYSPDLHEILSQPEAPYDWVIPNILEKADRVVITGGEGLGKSTILRQVGVQSAIGIHPFTLAPMPALRVLVIDCENSLKQSRRHLRGLAQVAERSGAQMAPGMYRMNCRPGGLDLTTSEDAEWLLDRVRVNQPQLLIIGPLYRLHVGNPNDEEVARRVTVVLDAARSLTDCAVMLEAHSGHAEQVGKPRQLRPLGSSLYLRWPEFGYGMARCADDTGETHPEFVDLRAWRGPRDERAWPTLLHKSIGSWPWESSDYAMKKLAQ